MKTLSGVLIILTLVLGANWGVLGFESEVVEKEGLKALQMGASTQSIEAGKTLEVGLFFQHSPKYHTYWKAPGIVGAPTTIDWSLPEGFTASEIEWPVPELTKMAEYGCYGYESDACLITKISVPKNMEADSVTIKAKISFMCCAKLCYPGWQEFSITLPVNKTGKPSEVNPKWEKRIAATRKIQSVAPPEDWTFQFEESEDVIELQISSEEEFSGVEGAYCFCEQGLVHSNRPQTITRSADKKSFSFKLIPSGFGPKDPKHFEALLLNPNGWPGTSSKWIKLKVPFSSEGS